MERLLAELKEVHKESGIGAEVKKGMDGTDTNVELETFIFGPDGTPWEGAFQQLIEFPRDYPFHAPKVRFLSPVFHPNVSRTGELAVDHLAPNGGQWNPTCDTRLILLSTRGLLSKPSLKLVANEEASYLYEKHNELYDELARSFAGASAVLDGEDAYEGMEFEYDSKNLRSLWNRVGPILLVKDEEKHRMLNDVINLALTLLDARNEQDLSNDDDEDKQLLHLSSDDRSGDEDYYKMIMKRK